MLYNTQRTRWLARLCELEKAIRALNTKNSKFMKATFQYAATAKNSTADPPLQLSSTSAMQAAKQHTLQINVQAKSNNFDFKFKATQILPTWKFQRLSVSIKIRRFFLRLNSESTPLFHRPHKKQTLKSKLLRIFQKLRIPRTKKLETVKKLSNAESSVNRLKRIAYEVLISMGTSAAGFLAFFLQSITRKYKKGFLLCVLGILVAAFTSPQLVNLNDYLQKVGEYVWDYTENAWPAIISSFC